MRAVEQAKEDEEASGSDDEEEDASADAAEAGDDAALTAEERVLKEMEALREREVADAKRTRKKRRELKKRAKIRLAQSAATSGIGEEVDEGEEALFRLDQVKGAKGLAAAGAHLFLPLWFPVNPTRNRSAQTTRQALARASGIALRLLCSQS